AGAQPCDLLPAARHVAHEVIDADRAAALLDVADARRGEADDVLGDHVGQAERGHRQLLDDLEDRGPPDVALPRYDGDDHRVAAAELAADAAVDLNEGMPGGQAGLDIEF